MNPKDTSTPKGANIQYAVTKSAGYFSFRFCVVEVNVVVSRNVEKFTFCVDVNEAVVEKTPSLQ